MTPTKKKAKTIHVRFSDKDPRDKLLWAQMEADKADDTVIMSALIKGLLKAYYDYRELTGSTALPPIIQVGSGMPSEPRQPAPVSKPIDLSDPQVKSFAAALDFD